MAQALMTTGILQISTPKYPLNSATLHHAQLMSVFDNDECQLSFKSIIENLC